MHSFAVAVSGHAILFEHERPDVNTLLDMLFTHYDPSQSKPHDSVFTDSIPQMLCQSLTGHCRCRSLRFGRRLIPKSLSSTPTPTSRLVVPCIEAQELICCRRTRLRRCGTCENSLMGHWCSSRLTKMMMFAALGDLIIRRLSYNLHVRSRTCLSCRSRLIIASSAYHRGRTHPYRLHASNSCLNVDMTPMHSEPRLSSCHSSP